jgi:AAA domain
MSTETKRPRISLDVNENLIPDELAALDRWLNWKPRCDAAKGRWDKLPVDGLTDRKIDCTKPGNLKPLAQVLEAQERARTCFQEMMKLSREERQYVPLYGVGFSLAKGLPGLERLKGVDLDHCINGAGRVAQWAQDIVDALRTYTEISPSGTGLRLFVKGDLPEGYKHKVTGLGPDGRGVIEVYEEGRFLTITGDVYWGSDEDPGGDAEDLGEIDPERLYKTLLPDISFRIQERDLSCLARYVAAHGAESTDAHWRGEKEPAGDEMTLPDSVIVSLLCVQPLWKGDTSEHNGDHSAADLALCNLIAQHTDSPAQVDRIFRQSGLMRDKWDEKRGSWTYGEMTIDRALGESDEVETMEPVPEFKSTGRGTKNPWAQGDRGDELMVKTLPEQKWAVEGLIPEGVTLLAGTKSIGKSWLALNLALAVSSGGRAFDRIPVQQGEVLYLNLEDGERRLQDRLHTVLRGDTSFPGLRHFHPRYDSPLLGAGLEDGLAAWMDYCPETKLVVIDLLANVFMPRDRKSEYFETYKVLSRFRKIADDIRIPILVLHHTNTRQEADLNDPFDSILGGQAIKGCVAGCLVLRRARGNAEMSLMVAGKDVQESVFTLQRDDAWHIRLLDEPPRAALTPERMAIRRAVEAGYREPASVSRFLGKPREVIKKTMQRMGVLGQLRPNGDGSYDLP